MTGEASRVNAHARAGVVLAAGGLGRRLGSDRPKQYFELAGEPLLVHAIRPYLEHPAVDGVVAALPPEDAARPPGWLTGLDPRIMVVPGGETRGRSVHNALEALPDDVEVALVHDAARPFVDLQLIERVIRAVVERGAGAIAALPVTDTIKVVDSDDRIVDTPVRDRLWRAQTPQGFPTGLILDAYRRAAADGITATDDAALVERYGGTVYVVEGDERNIKVTGPEDLALAAALVRGPSDPFGGTVRGGGSRHSLNG